MFHLSSFKAFLLALCLQSSLIDLKEHASSLASSGLKKDSKLKTLEIAIEQKKEECTKLETQLQKVSATASLQAKMYNFGNIQLAFFWLWWRLYV